MLREVTQNEIFTILFVICIAILTIAKLLYTKRFNDFIWIISNSNYHKIYSRDLRFFDRFNILLFVNQLINIAIFVYIIFFSLGENNYYGNTFIIQLSIFLMAFILFKFFLERIIGRVFDIPEIIDNYLFQKLNYKNYLGLLLIPINILLTYTLTPSNLTIYTFLAFLILINFVGFLYSFKSYQKLLLSNIFYFILYLCALEIGPYIILYKLFI